MISERFEFIEECGRSVADQLLALYIEADWWGPESDDDPDIIGKMVSGSDCFLTLSIKDEIIGMGRAIGDGISDIYIQDIYVRKDHRGKRYGSSIVQKIAEYLRDSGYYWISLVGRPGTEEFYKRLGFEKMEEYVPMILKS